MRLFTLWNKKRCKRHRWIKVDVQKKCDRVDWQVVFHILKLVGFDDKIVLLIFRCLSSISAKLLLNGLSFWRIPMEHEIRQRDPIYSCLWSYMNDYLECCFNLNKWRNSRCEINRLSLSVTHLFFVNDLLIFCRANAEEVDKVVKCLRQYCS